MRTIKAEIAAPTSNATSTFILGFREADIDCRMIGFTPFRLNYSVASM
jgi:hypothetical protein